MKLKFFIIIFSLGLFSVVLKAQNAIANYEAELKILNNQPVSLENSKKKGALLGKLFTERTKEIGYDKAYLEIVDLTKKIKYEDFYQAQRLLYTTSDSDYSKFLTDAFTADERALIRKIATYQQQSYNAKLNNTTIAFPSDVPQPGFGVSGKPSSNTIAKNNTTNSTVNTSPKIVDDGAKEVNLGVEAAKNKNFSEAKKQYEIAASKGNSIALINLGIMNFYAEGMPKNEAKAIEYFQKSAEKENGDANYMMAYVNAHGISIPQNAKKSIEYFNKAVKFKSKTAIEIQQKATKGKAQFPQSIIDAKKLMAENKFSEAIITLEKAAEKDNPNAMFLLGELYSNKNFKNDGFYEAYYWLLQGARLFDENSIDLNYKVYEEHKKTLYQLFGSSINELGMMSNLIGHRYRENDEEIALRWYKRGINYGKASSALMCGLIYYNPKKIKKDLVLAKQYFEIAQKMGDTTAASMLQTIDMETKK